MAYFGAASPDTILEPIRDAGENEDLNNYNANGIIIQPGITVGEYGRRVMESIYGTNVEQQEKTTTVKVA